jgi:hypothetical protein
LKANSWQGIAETEAPSLSVALQVADMAVAAYSKLNAFYEQPASLVLVSGAAVA